MTQEDLKEMTSGTVRLVGVNNKYHVAPVFIAPKFNDVTKTFTIGGKEYKTKIAEENNEKIFVADGTPIRITDLDAFRYTHLQSFDLAFEEQRFLLSMALDDAMVAPNKEAVNPDSEHRYYIEDKESEALDAIKKSTLVYDAMQKIKDMPLEEQVDYARLLGIYRPDISKTRIEAELMRIAMEKPSEITKIANDRDSKHKVFLKKLVNAGIVRVANGKYLNGTELVGANEDFAIQFLRDEHNSKLIADWTKMLTSNSKEKTVASKK